MKNILLLGGEIVVDRCEKVFACAPDADWEKHFEVMRGKWERRDGALIGEYPGNQGGILLTRREYGDGYMMRCRMGTVLPATRDVNCIFCGHWDYGKDCLDDSYICGLNGWYDGKSGIERNDDGYFKSLTNSYRYTPGTEVEMCVGSFGGHTFMVVDDELVTEFIDPVNPLCEGRFGFSPYCTRLRVRDVEISKIFWRAKEQSYTPEFK